MRKRIAQTPTIENITLPADIYIILELDFSDQNEFCFNYFSESNFLFCGLSFGAAEIKTLKTEKIKIR